jgi:uncharacterized protein YqcC (DUF446 family)
MLNSICAILPSFWREIRLDKHHKLADLLLNLEKVMRQVNVWEMPEPSQQALVSQQPFCIDSMGFDQWIKFVMLEKFKIILSNGDALPSTSNIAVMAQEFYKTHDKVAKDALISALEAIDLCLSQD